MGEYEHTATINCRAQKVFEFASDVRNFPLYLPTVRNVIKQGSEHVRVQGEARGRPYASDGMYHVDYIRKRMEWGSDSDDQYSGWLEVKGNDTTATVTVHLTFEPHRDYDPTIHEGLENALASIKNLCEGTGGKVEAYAA